MSFTYVLIVLYVILMLLYAFTLVQAHAPWRLWLPFWIFLVIGLTIYNFTFYATAHLR